ncbi:Topoisomerase 1-associated factor 1 [Linnemannia zychae]|nr:Topoisomerase 1-associated factor 1 [Linnemannia zychae]
MDPDTESLLVSTCLALGGFEDRSENPDDTTQVYVMGDECLECLKDIKKFIKYYEEAGDNVALTFLGKMGILEKDLIPIILLNTPADNSTKERLVLACIELMVPMTWIIDYEELKKIATAEEDDSVVGNLYEKNEILRGYKKAFLQPGVLSAVFSVLLRPLQIEYRLRTTRDTAIIRLGLSLFRNLVAIRDAESSLSGSMDQFISTIMQDQLLERLQEENVMSLLVTLASSSMEAQLAEWNAITMEIFYYVFLGIDPEDLLPAVVSSTGSVKNTKLEELLRREEKERTAQSSAGRKRHDRFGTTGEARLMDGRRVVLHQKGALFTSIDKQLDNVKKVKAKTKRLKELDDFKKTLTRSGVDLLRNLALTLLESCFNPLFTSIRKDIGRDKVKPHHHSQYYVLMTFLLRFRRVYVDNLIKQPRQNRNDIIEQDMMRLVNIMKTFFRHEPERLKELTVITDAQDWAKLQALSESALSAHQRSVFENKKTEIMQLQQEKLKKLEEDYLKSVESWDFDLVATAVDKMSVFQTIQYMRNKFELKDKSIWSDLRKAMDCFQEMLVTLNGMYKSPKGQYHDASDNVQNNLYYEEGTLELFLTMIKAYKNQSPKYLMTLIGMNHVLLKMLETYSQEKSYVGIMKREKNRKKKKTKEMSGEEAAPTAENPDEPSTEQEPSMDEPDNNQDSDNDDDKLPSHTFKEHQFVFKDFERRYATETVLSTYFAFLENYADLSEIQLRWIAAMFYRIAINCSNTAVFYKASNLQLFHQILDSGLLDPKGDLVRFIYHLLRQFFKKLQEYPLLIVDVFAPKPRKVCQELIIGRLEAEKIDIQISAKKEKRLMATELEIVDPTRPEEEQIKIAVMSLYDEDKADLVEWAIELLKDGIVQRELMTLRTESELAENPDLMYSVEGVEDIPIKPNTPARQKSIRIEPRFRLLLKLIKFTREDSDSEIRYKIPKDLPTDTMVHYQTVIESVEQYSADNEAQYQLEELIKKINKSSRGVRKPGLGGSRVIAEKEPVVYHSAEYVIDSEDDDEEYFKGEKQLRDKTAIAFSNAEKRHREMIENNERLKTQKQKEVARVKRAALKGTMVSLSDEDEDEDRTILEGIQKSNNDVQRSPTATASTSSRRKATISLESDEDDEDNDSNESNSDKDASPSRPTVSKGTNNESSTQPRRRLISLSDDEDDEDEDEDDEEDQMTQPLPRTASRINKRRIVLEDSDDDDDGHLSSTQGSPAKKRHAFEE